MIKILCLLMLAIISHSGFTQPTYLMLQKKNRNKNAYYKAGDKISFRINDGRKKYSGEIADIRDSTIVFRGFDVEVGEISSLYIDEKTRWWLRYKIEQLSFIIGGGYLLLNLINEGELSDNILIVSGSFIATGLLARAIIGHRIKIKGRTKLKIVKL